MTQVAFHPGGRHLLTLSRGRRCLVWDLDREQPLGWASGEQPVSAAVWAPDGAWLALEAPVYITGTAMVIDGGLRA